ncbi:MAG: CotH kinase family protein, partial [Paludibacteraceae bacterium]|nr:CotH kinase family protein [Paludibacteraceae bacterium]
MLFVLLLANLASAQRVMPIVKMYGEFGNEYTKGKIIVLDPDSLIPDTFDIYAKYRGGTSKNFQKKNYAVKLVDSSDSKMSVRLIGMRSDNSWILDAMAVDKARMRNR